MALTDDLVAYWKLDEASGNRVSQVNSHTLTDNDAVGAAAGKLNNAASFSEDYLSRANASLGGLNPNGNVDFTISLWFRYVGDATFTLISVNDGASEGYQLWVDSGYPKWVVSGGTSLAYTGDPLSDGTWYHVLVERDAAESKIRIRINNGTAEELTQPGGFSASSADLRVGADWNSGAGPSLTLEGLMDEIGVWSRLLTGPEQATLYGGGTPPAYPFASAPTAPSNLAASSITATGFTLTWDDNASDETGFVIEKSIANADSWSAVSTPAANAETAPIAGLTANTLYDVRIKATGASGDSDWVVLQDVLTLPAASTIGTATGGNGQTIVRFTPGASGEGDELEFTATSTPGSVTGTGATSPITVTGLDNGKAYTFVVKATNTTGDSANSAASNLTTCGVPATVALNGTIGT